MSRESDLRDLQSQASAAYRQGRAVFVARIQRGASIAFPVFRRMGTWTPQDRPPP